MIKNLIMRKITRKQLSIICEAKLDWVYEDIYMDPETIRFMNKKDYYKACELLRNNKK